MQPVVLLLPLGQSAGGCPSHLPQTVSGPHCGHLIILNFQISAPNSQGSCPQISRLSQGYNAAV